MFTAVELFQSFFWSDISKLDDTSTFTYEVDP
jgi:hypothetical protein